MLACRLSGKARIRPHSGGIQARCSRPLRLNRRWFKCVDRRSPTDPVTLWTVGPVSLGDRSGGAGFELCAPVMVPVTTPSYCTQLCSGSSCLPVVASSWRYKLLGIHHLWDDATPPSWEVCLRVSAGLVAAGYGSGGQVHSACAALPAEALRSTDHPLHQNRAGSTRW